MSSTHVLSAAGTLGECRPCRGCFGRDLGERLFGVAKLPAAHHVERAVEVALAAGMPLDLAAGSFRNRAGTNQHDRIDGQVVLAGHRAADRLEDLAELPLLVPLDLENQHKLLASVFFHGERCAAISPQPRMAALHGQFDVLRVVVHAAENDQVLQPAGHK